MSVKNLTRALTVVAGLSVLPVTQAHAEEMLPQRKAGMWELKTSMDEGRGPREQTMKLCIDAEMEANTVKASLAEHKQNCEKYEIKKDGAKTVVNMICTYNGRHVESLTEMEGDFSKSFNIRIASTTADTRESTQQTITIKRVILQDGTYLGESCGDLKGGEALAADGTKVMVQ